jgi:hypothetical protein
VIFHNDPNGRPIKAEADRESITCHLRTRTSGRSLAPGAAPSPSLRSRPGRARRCRIWCKAANGLARPSAYSTCPEPIPSKRADCRSYTVGGAAAGGVSSGDRRYVVRALADDRFAARSGSDGVEFKVSVKGAAPRTRVGSLAFASAHRPAVFRPPIGIALVPSSATPAAPAVTLACETVAELTPPCELTRCLLSSSKHTARSVLLSPQQAARSRRPGHLRNDRRVPTRLDD